MTDRDTENRIIELRARGKSYSTIASELKIGKQTALDVCKKYKEQIATLQALELEQLYEEQRITSQERITAIASLMHRVREEIDRRDLTQVPTEKLIDLYLKQASTLKEEIIEPNFQSSEEQARDRQEREYLDRLTATS
jgi:transcriptional regulator